MPKLTMYLCEEKEKAGCFLEPSDTAVAKKLSKWHWIPKSQYSVEKVVENVPDGHEKVLIYVNKYFIQNNKCWQKVARRQEVSYD